MESLSRDRLGQRDEQNLDQHSPTHIKMSCSHSTKQSLVSPNTASRCREQARTSWRRCQMIHLLFEMADDRFYNHQAWKGIHLGAPSTKG